jgi:hypothetical protein
MTTIEKSVLMADAFASAIILNQYLKEIAEKPEAERKAELEKMALIVANFLPAAEA